MEKFLTINEVCKMFNITRQTVSKYIKEGKIKAIKYERAVRIPANQFENFTKSPTD